MPKLDGVFEEKFGTVLQCTSHHGLPRDCHETSRVTSADPVTQALTYISCFTLKVFFQ